MNRGHSLPATLSRACRACRRIPDSLLLLVEALALVAVVAASAAAWKSWPAVPYGDPDSWGYLNPALSWLDGLGFQQTDGRDWLYPALLAFFIKSTGSISGIVVWQRALCALSGLLMGATWRCWVSMLPANRWLRFAATLFGLWPIWLQLTNQQSMAYVMEIRPEGILVCFVYAQLACLVIYCKYRWQTPRELPSLLAGVGALFFAYACLALKPSWVGAFAATSLPVLVGCLGRAISWKIRLSTVAAGILLVALTLWLPPKLFLIRDSTSVTFLPETLFCIHAPLIVHRLEARLATLPDSDAGKARLSAFLNVVKKDLEASRHVRGAYEKLGFDPDYLMYSSELISTIRDYSGGDDQKFRTFCIHSYVEAVIYDPAGYAQKVLSQAGHFFPPAPKDFLANGLDIGKAYKDSVSVIRPEYLTRFHGKVQQMFLQYVADETAVSSHDLMLGKSRDIRELRKQLSAVTLPLEFLFLAGLLGAILWRPLSGLRMSGVVVLLIFSAPLGNAMTVCLIHALDIERYRFTYSGFVLFALAAMAVYMLAVSAGVVRYFLMMRSRVMQGATARNQA